MHHQIDNRNDEAIQEGRGEQSSQNNFRHRALYFIAGGLVTGGIRIETDGTAWLCILGVALPATAVSNMTLVQAIKRIGPTLTSVFGALEPLTAVVIGVAVFGEPFTVQGAAGILLIVAAVTIVILHSGRRKA